MELDSNTTLVKVKLLTQKNYFNKEIVIQIQLLLKLNLTHLENFRLQHYIQIQTLVKVKIVLLPIMKA